MSQQNEVEVDPVLAAVDEVLKSETDTSCDTAVLVSAEAMQRLRAAVEEHHQRGNAPGLHFGAEDVLYELAVRLGLDPRDQPVTADIICKHVEWLEERSRAEERRGA